MHLQKGIQYAEIEAHVDNRGEEITCNQPFSLISKHTCQASKSSKKRKAEDGGSSAPMSIGSGAADGSANAAPEVIEEDYITRLRGHEGEVFICSWNPVRPDLLASGSGDSTARLWTIPAGPSGRNAGTQASSSSYVLKHSSNKPGEKTKDVTTLDWRPDGKALATGSYDGIARLWDDRGNFVSTLQAHKGPIFSLKWNRRGNYILSGSVDKTAMVWDFSSGALKQVFQVHTAPTLDCDWRDDLSFATCSTDQNIFVCQVGSTEPLAKFSGHTNEVNSIKWSGDGRMLASCSDDFSARIWQVGSSTAVRVLVGHKKEIYSIRWNKTGPGTANPSKRPILGTASFDHTIKLWDPETGACVQTLEKHTDPVYSIAFSPDGEYMASGSFDRNLHIWSLKDGNLIKTCKASGGLFEVCWNAQGNRIAGCSANNGVFVVDFRS